jgi:hypothetical protein
VGLRSLRRTLAIIQMREMMEVKRSVLMKMQGRKIISKRSI